MTRRGLRRKWQKNSIETVYWLRRDEKQKRNATSAANRGPRHYLDTTGRKNGRGAYICPNSECMRRARKSKGLERAFKMPIPDEIYDSLTKEIEVFE